MLYWKYFQCSDAEIFPEVRGYTPAQLEWETSSENDCYSSPGSRTCYKVTGFEKEVMTRRNDANSDNNYLPEPTVSRSRWQANHQA